MDTQTKITELLGTGISQETLAELLNCGQSTISSLKTGKRGKRTSYELGQRIDNLHAERIAPQVERRRTDSPPRVSGPD